MSEARKGVKQRGKPRPKTDLEEASRAEVAAALKRVGRGPCSVSAELFRHTGMAQWLKTGKGLGPENVAKALEWARSVPKGVELPANPHAFEEYAGQLAGAERPEPEPLHHGTIHCSTLGCAAKRPASRRFCLNCDPPTYKNGKMMPDPHFGQETFDPEPYPEVRLRSHDEIMAALTPEPEPDPAAFVLETWAAARLTYAMETLGLTMPEGYRFRVSVERA